MRARILRALTLGQAQAWCAKQVWSAVGLATTGWLALIALALDVRLGDQTSTLDSTSQTVGAAASIWLGNAFVLLVAAVAAGGIYMVIKPWPRSECVLVAIIAAVSFLAGMSASDGWHRIAYAYSLDPRWMLLRAPHGFFEFYAFALVPSAIAVQAVSVRDPTKNARPWSPLAFVVPALIILAVAAVFEVFVSAAYVQDAMKHPAHG